MFTRGKFNNASALGRSLYWCQALHIMNKDRYQSTSARRALALLNSPLNLSIFTVFLKNKNIILKMRRSKVTDYAALSRRPGYRQITEIQRLDVLKQVHVLLACHVVLDVMKD